MRSCQKLMQCLFLITVINVCISNLIISQDDNITFAKKIYSMTTVIEVFFPGGYGTASGFFYQSGADSYLVSNRHVFYPKENCPDSIIFCLRMDDKTGMKKAKWLRIMMDKEFLRTNLKLHSNKEIDVASIRITKLLTFPAESAALIHKAFAVRAMDSLEIEFLNPEVGDDVLIVGYPRGYYDDYNLIPIVKQGIISTFYGPNFKNEPKFLIDCRLFHGSSGSIVISKYKEVIFSKGEPKIAPVKDFVFLGIYSGEPFIYGPQIDTDEEVFRKKEYMDLGEVWYPSVLEELSYGLVK